MHLLVFWIYHFLWALAISIITEELLRPFPHVLQTNFGMVVITITLVAVLDFLATRKHPLLRIYNHGVNVGVLQPLLLVHRADMETVEFYFATRSRCKSVDIPLISEDQPSPQSFSVRFAESNPHCQEIKDRILEVAATKERENLEEVSRRREIHDELLESAP